MWNTILHYAKWRDEKWRVEQAEAALLYLVQKV